MSNSRPAASRHHLRAIAFLTRSIRQDSRLLSHHVMRAVMPGIILYIFFLQLELATRRAAAGGDFAGWVVNCCYWFLTLVGGLHFSTAIVEETEEQTLPLLQMTGASPFAILLGKSLPRLAVALLFLIVALPFLTLALTLGGVLPLGLFSAMLGLMVYAVMLSQLGLLASVISRTATEAFSKLVFFWVMIELCHWWAWLLTRNGLLPIVSTVGIEWIDWLGANWNLLVTRMPEVSLFGNLGQTLLSFIEIDVAAESSLWQRIVAIAGQIWSFRMSVQLVIAVCCFVASWLCFRSERIQTMVAELNGLSGIKRWLRRDRRMARVGRVSGNALRWKSWQLLGGGAIGFLFRLLGLPVLIGTACWGFLAMLDTNPETTAVAGMSFFIGVLAFAVNGLRLFGSLVNPEIHEKTLPALIMLPQSTSRTLKELVYGALPALLAGGSTCLLSFLVLFSWMAARTPADMDDLLEAVFQPWVWHVVAVFVLNLVLGLLLTTYFRYGGMLLAFGLIVIGFFLGMFTLFAFAAFVGGGPGSEDMFLYVIPLGLIFVEILISVALWKKLIVRLEELAAR